MEQFDVGFDMTVCFLCRKLLQDPKTLPCTDTFCLKCLEDTKRSGEWELDSFCPQCRTPFTIPTAGLQSLPTCDFLMMKIHRQVIENQGNGNKICDVCSQAVSEASAVSNAVVYCVTCQQKLCDRCYRCHTSFPATKSHSTVVLAAGAAHLHTVYSRDDLKIHCFNHHQQPAKLHCSNCSQLLCSGCEIQHTGHDLQTIDDATQRNRYELGKAIDRLNERVEHSGAQFVRSDYQLNNLKAGITSSAEDARRLIDEHKDKLIDKLESLRSENNAKKAALSTSLKTLKFANELVSNGSVRDFSSFGKPALDLINGHLQWDVIDQPTVNFYSFESSWLKNMARHVNLVGAISSSSSNSVPELRFEIPSLRPDDAVVGLTSINDLLFILRSPCNQEIFVFNILSRKQQTTLRVRQLGGYGAHGLTSCVTNNCLYVSNSRTNIVLKIELTDDNSVTSWKVGIWPEELSVNAACNLLVACFKDGVIQEFTTKGKLVREISLQLNIAEFRPFHAVQLANGLLVISGCKGGLPCNDYDVVEVDTTGRVVISYTEALMSTTKQKFSYPSQLVVDKRDENIFVADSDNNRIVMFNRPSQEVPTVSAREFNASSVKNGLIKPWSISFDEGHNRLFIGEANWRSYSRVFVFDNVTHSANS